MNSAQGPRITGTVVIDARIGDLSYHEELAAYRNSIDLISCAPAGATVVVIVSPGSHPHARVDYLRTEIGHLAELRIECSDPATIRRWCDAFRRRTRGSA